VSLLNCAGVGSSSQNRTYEKNSKVLTFLIVRGRRVFAPTGKIRGDMVLYGTVWYILYWVEADIPEGMRFKSVQYY
jgi:hypothetical protein